MCQPSVVLATASYDHTIRFWEAKSGRCDRTIQYPESYLAQSIKGYRRSGRSEFASVIIPLQSKETGSIFTPDKCGLAAAENPHIRLFDVNSNSSQPTELISGDQNRNIRIWDLRANSCSCELVPKVDTAVGSLTVMWDGSLIVAANNRASSDSTARLWSLSNGEEIKVYKGHQKATVCCAFLDGNEPSS